MQTVNEWLAREDVQRVREAGFPELLEEKFFRDPMRPLHYDPAVFYSPADGFMLYSKIVAADERIVETCESGGQVEMSKRKLTESFNWLMPFKAAFEGAKHLIKGAAITIGKTKNAIPYTGDELLRSARTLTQKPLLINHLETVHEVEMYLQGYKDDGKGGWQQFNPETIPEPVRKALEGMVARGATDVGHVLDSEFEDDAVEYVAHVTDPLTQAVVDAQPSLVKGVSIGAFPRIMSNPPQGIIFADLSLITDPETPADPDATAEIMEKLREMLRPRPTAFNIRDVNHEMLSRLNHYLDKVPLEQTL